MCRGQGAGQPGREMGLIVMPGTEREIFVAPPEVEQPLELPPVPAEQPLTPVHDPVPRPS